MTELPPYMYVYVCTMHPRENGLPWWLSGEKKKKICLLMQETQEKCVQFLSGDDPLEEEMATHSSIAAWKIP